jgi:chromosome segregation ATPase
MAMGGFPVSEEQGVDERISELEVESVRFRELLGQAGDEIRNLRERLAAAEALEAAGRGFGEDSGGEDLKRTIALQNETIIDLQRQLRERGKEAGMAQALQAEVAELKEQLEDSERLRERHRKTVTALEEAKGGHQQELEKLRAEVADARVFTAQKAQLEEQVRDARKSLQEGHRQRGELASRLELAERQIEGSRQLEEQLAEVRAKATEAEEERRSLTLQLEQAGRELKARVRELESANEALSELRSRAERTRAETDQAQSELKAAVEDLQKMRDRANELRGERDDLASRLEVATQELKSLRGDLAVGRSQRLEVEAALTAAREAERRSEEQCGALKTEQRELQLRLERAEAQSSEVVAEVDRLQAARERDRQTNSQLAAELAELRVIETRYQKLLRQRGASESATTPEPAEQSATGVSGADVAGSAVSGRGATRSDALRVEAPRIGGMTDGLLLGEDVLPTKTMPEERDRDRPEALFEETGERAALRPPAPPGAAPEREPVVAAKKNMALGDALIAELRRDLGDLDD